ncbi:MAG: hypothetical protein K8R87_00670 [Verrucomicrobia bacterium]|nr:hypothetical protein [Verrucomicrobiota bacterium]
MTTSAPTTTKNSRPWIWIVITLVVMVLFWSVVVTIAVKKLPDSVPVTYVSPPADAHN